VALLSKFTSGNTKVIFFDMNNTLVDPKRSFAESFKLVLDDFTGRWEKNEEADPKKALEVYLAEWQKRQKWLKKHPGKTEEAKKQCLAVSLASFPFEVDDRFAANFFGEMRSKTAEHAVLYPFAAEAVEALSKRYKIGIITNGNKDRQEQVLARHKLSRFIPAGHLFASSSIGSRKPNPAIFRTAAKKMGASASECVMVGDSWKNDVLGAVRSGMNAVWLCRAPQKITRRSAGKKSIAVVRDFRALLNLFR
jgi:putative hydrolase of the HAD superfamily